MADTYGVAKGLGLFDDPIDEVGSIARTLKTVRELSGPGPREKFQWQKQLDGYKTALGHIESIITNKNIDPASKEWTYQILDHMAANASPELRPAVMALRGARYLSEEQRRVREFKKMFGERPAPPRDSEGNQLARTPENEFAWAQYIFQTQQYDYMATGAAFGTDMAKLMKFPKALMINPPEESTSAEGKKSITGRVWYLEPRTRIPMSLPYQSLGMPGEEELKKMGYPLSRVLMEGQFPEPGMEKEMTVGGRNIKARVMRNLLTGERQLDETFLGRTDPQNVPKELAEVWAAAQLDLDTDKMQPWQQKLTEMLREEVEFDDPGEYFAKAEELNQALAPMLRGWKVLPNISMDAQGRPHIRGLAESKKHKAWSLLDDRFYVKDFAWTIVPWTGEMVTVQDAYGNEGAFYRVKRKDGGTHLVSATGEILDNSKNARDGDTIPGVQIGKQALRKPEAGEVVPYAAESAAFVRGLQAFSTFVVEKFKEATEPGETPEIDWSKVPKSIREDLTKGVGEDKAKEIVKQAILEYQQYGIGD